MRTPPLGLLFCSLLPATALAAGTAGMSATAQDGKSAALTLEYRDTQTLRMTVADASEGYLVMREGKVYSVLSNDGQPTVLDLAAVRENMPARMRGKNQGPGGRYSTGAEDIKEIVSLDDTGRDETVAGIVGDIWTLVYVDGEGQKETRELVLSGAPAVRELSATLLSLGRTMAAMADRQPGAQLLVSRLEENGLGMLRLGDTWTLTSLDTRVPDAARFELPAEPQTKPDLGTLRSLRDMRDRRSEGG